MVTMVTVFDCRMLLCGCGHHNVLVSRDVAEWNLGIFISITSPSNIIIEGEISNIIIEGEISIIIIEVEISNIIIEGEISNT